jgi:hypothetical protein
LLLLLDSSLLKLLLVLPVGLLPLLLQEAVAAVTSLTVRCFPAVFASARLL